MSKELSTKLSDEQIAILESSYPVETSFNRILLPRLGFYSQDVTEGKGKAMKVVTEAGTFYTEVETDEIDETTEKKIWKKTELGSEIDAIVLYERKQLKFFDGENYTSSPIYDSDDQIIPLFSNKQEVDRGTPADLKARKEYQGKSAKGKAISKLEENKILYVLMEGVVYQFSIRGTSMYAFKDYKKTVKPNTVLTHMTSKPNENGSIAWNSIVWEATRTITPKEFDIVMGHTNQIVSAVKMEQAFYSSKEITEDEAGKAFDALPAGKKRATDM